MARVCRAVDEPHHHSLELQATRALSRGDALAAFELADRRCRISPPPEAHSYMLRAEALYRLNDKRSAIADVASALSIAPDDLRANRRMLAWAQGRSQKEAAATLIKIERNAEVLRRAIDVMRGGRRDGFASIAAFDDAIEGWAAWEKDGPIEVTVTDGVDLVKIALDPDPAHEFGAIGRGRSFRVRRPPSPRLQSIVVSAADRVLSSTQSLGRLSVIDEELQSPLRVNSQAPGPTVIVPVYGDYEATRACLESLVAELDRAPGCRVVIVDDASPDRRIAPLLARIAERPRIELLTNPRNLGFIGATNRALREFPDGDVILLNADTIVPPNFISRLSAASSSSNDIGMVMPLSNNGDLASFPVPFVDRRIGSREDVERIDLIAAEVNADQVVDIPNGIGFCLYITRACIDAIGVLSEDFERGYLEDVDYCLRARERGFRIVCAPSVYVGHAGSKSFGKEKRSLVVRNARVLHARHPEYSLEFAVFGNADPLRECRQAIARRMIPRLENTRLLIAGAGAVGDVAKWRGRRLVAAVESVLMLEVRRLSGGVRVILSNSGGGEPESTQFDLGSRSQGAALVAFLRAANVSRIEIFDPIRVPFALIDLIAELDAPYDVVIADAGLLGVAGAAALSAIDRSSRECGGESSATSFGGNAWVQRWRAIADGAESMLAVDEHARAFAARLFPMRRIRNTFLDDPRAERRARPVGRIDGGRLGLLPVRLCAREQRLMREVANTFRRFDPELKLLAIGATLDDLGLMRAGNIHVTGPVEGPELRNIAESHRVACLFASVTQPLFGHPLLSAAFNGPQPLAYFDWSPGAVSPREGDLPLDPHQSVETLAATLLHWFQTANSDGRRPRNRLH